MSRSRSDVLCETQCQQPGLVLAMGCVGSHAEVRCKSERAVTVELDVHGSSDVMEYMDELITEMVGSFGITRDEAVGRINRIWGGRTFESYPTILHQMPYDWARDIYYGVDSYWWMVSESERQPLPYP